MATLSKEAKQWLKDHKDDIPPVLEDQIGSRPKTGSRGNSTSIEPFDEQLVSSENDPYPTQLSKKRLKVWPGQGDAADKSSSRRPVEDELDI